MAEAEKDGKGVGWRCTTCGITWPQHDLAGRAFNPCASCKEEIDLCSGVRPMPLDEAIDLRNHFEFDRHYEDKHIPRLRLTDDEKERFTLANWKAEVRRDKQIARLEPRRATG